MSLLRPLAFWLSIVTLCFTLAGCDRNDGEASVNAPPGGDSAKNAERDFQWEVDRFADIRVLKYKVPGFEALPLETKTLLYYLAEAALAGRDIMWDQNNRYNLRVRAVIDTLMKHYAGDRNTPAFQAFTAYAKQVWFASGIHHHYSSDKFIPEFTHADLLTWASSLDNTLWQQQGIDIKALLDELNPVIFDPAVMPKKVNRDLHADKVLGSAVNFYEGVSEAEVTAFYQAASANDGETPISHGLNSKLMKVNGEIIERVWKIDGMYGAAIERIVSWLEKAITVAENAQQRQALELLVKYYRSGDLADFDAYNIAWVKDTQSRVDVINGFIEVYNDPLGYKGSFESVVSVKDAESTKRIAAIAEHAQWFEDHSPIMDAHKREKVVGITGKVITVVMESGDASPSTPIGINLPNANWIRAEHGSKSVSLGNIVAAYDAAGDKALEEFGHSAASIAREKQYSEIAGYLRTDMHEVIGHASGKINPGVGSPNETLKHYASALEEARADLVALYYLLDPKLIEVGVMPHLDVGRVGYDAYLRNGLMTQLFRIKLGDQIEQSHMQNRQLVSRWVLEQSAEDKAVEFVKRDNKTYVVINNYETLRERFGQLLREIQRIKSEGDFTAASQLVENYGKKVDRALHEEVLTRYEKLGLAPYSGFVNPVLTPVMNGDAIVDVKLELVESFVAQMLDYDERYNYLPLVN